MGALKSFGQFCPVAQAAEVVTERWTPLVIREMLCGSRRFSEIQRGVPLMSRSLLSKRLRELEHAGVVERRPLPGRGYAYHLTPAGEELRPLIIQLGIWGMRWAEHDLAAVPLDAALLMWDVRRRVRLDALPKEPVVVRFHFPAASAGKRRWWLVLRAEEVDLCLHDPGHEVDLRVEADLRAFTEVWMGQRDLDRCLHEGDLRIDGPTDLRRAFPSWLQLNHFAELRDAAPLASRAPSDA